MTQDIASLVSDNLDLWTSAVDSRAGSARATTTTGYGIQRLRRLILDLATRGRLVTQVEADGSGAQLLAELKSEKISYRARLGLPQHVPLGPPGSEPPFKIPPRWIWARLGDIAVYIQRGKSPIYQQGSGVLVVSQRCVQWAGLDIGVAKEISEASLLSYESYRFLEPGDLLWNSTGTGTIGRVIVVDSVPDRLVCDSHVTVVRCRGVEPRFLQTWLASDAVYGKIEARAAGTTNQIEWTARLAAEQWVPLPPIAEQRRIVEKVDELMRLCKKLESESAQAATSQEVLIEAWLAILLASPDSSAVAANWTRLQSYFGVLFTTEAAIDTLKQTILRLAVRGSLAPQLSSDEPVEDLLKAIREHRRKSRRKERKRSTQVGVPISEREQPFTLPKGWAFERFGDILVNRDAERVPVSSAAREARKGEYDYYGASGVIDKIDGYLFDEPLLLIGEDGANLISRSTPIAFIAHGKYWVNNHAHVLEAMSHELLRYMEIYINAIDLKPYVTGTAQPKMNQAKMNSIVVALPPEREIPRIIARVDELMGLCDALKLGIADAAETQRQLAEAIVEKAAA